MSIAGAPWFGRIKSAGSHLGAQAVTDHIEGISDKQLILFE